MLEAITLAACPVGLFHYGDTLALKTEYSTNEGRIDAYIVRTGEFFWGDAPQSIDSQRATVVVPVTDSELGRLRPSSADDPVLSIEGRAFMSDAGGRLVPVDLVKPEHKLEDQTVRKIVAYGLDLSAQVARFRGHTFDDINSFIDLLAEQYGGKRGGKKGNVTISSYDGTQKVTVQVQDQLSFGPELQVAKELVDECITAWSAGASDEIRALVEHAFQVDKEGRINRAALFQLRRLEIDDKQWRSAMAALGEAIRVIGSREYVRIYRREHARAKWLPVSIDIAQA